MFHEVPAMKPLEKLTETVTLLPRGGYLVDSPAGYIQFGAPPETIKDTMLLPSGTPLVYVLPTVFFNWVKGISVAELEFPINYNFFIRKQRTMIICMEEQADRLKQVLQESLFGPEVLELAGDFIHDYGEIPDIKKEMDYFRTMTLEDVVEFRFFSGGRYDLGPVSIERTGGDEFQVNTGTETIATVPGRIEYQPSYLIGERLAEPYRPPLFGITSLGTSSGFDPHENTSGFIIWLNHQGIMVDPPVNSTEWLLDSNVSPKFIDSIILTHCHADHDAGTFQKILEEGKITVYSTITIMNSFLRKYAALADVSTEYLKRLFDFRPITIGSPLYINDSRFDMHYTLHSIPTIGFRMIFQDQSLTYSSDHNGDPELHRTLLEKNVISTERYNQFRSFPWESTVIYHESGVPPLHTPIDFLNSLPEELQKKTVVYHIPGRLIPENTHLTMARFGMEHTRYFKSEPAILENAYQLLNMLKHIELAEGLDVSKAQEFVNIGLFRTYRKGEAIIKKGTPGDNFYIISYGNVSIFSEDRRYIKLLGPYDYFGEAALLRDEKRSTDVIAETEVSVYAIEKNKFLSFIEGTDYAAMLNRLVDIRDREAWETLSDSTFIRRCTATQRTYLESILHPVRFDGSGVLIMKDEPLSSVYIIKEGHDIMKGGDQLVAMLGKGDIVGSVLDLYNRRPSQYEFSHSGDISLYAVSADDFMTFSKRIPDW
jgi:CRP-like cAMP-binding protein